MSNVRVGRIEAEQSKMPPACMRCGAKASVWVARTFIMPADWVGFAKHQMTVRVPLCPDHRNHFTRSYRVHAIFFAVAAMLALTMFGGPTLLGFPHDLAVGTRLSGCFFVFVGGVAWAITAGVMDSRTIRPAEMTEWSVTLKNVHPNFQDALDHFRAANDAPPVPPAPQARPPQRGDQFYDPRRGPNNG